MTKRSFPERPSGVLAGVLAGAVVGMIAARSGVGPQTLGLGPAETVAFIVLLPLLLLVVLAAHELGHVVGGLIVDFRPLLFIVGPLRVERTTAGGLRYGVNRTIGLAGGLAASVPVGMHDLRRRTIVMIAGGPLASLMFGTQCLALYQTTSAIAPLTAAPLLTLGLLSLAIGIVTLLPVRTGGFYSDGSRLLRLMRAGEETEREVALLMLTSLSLAGTRPADWDPALVERSAGIRDGGPFEVAGRNFAYAHALDRGDIDTARVHLEAALAMIDRLPAGGRPSLLITAATFHALHDDDPELARALLARATGQSLLATPHERVLADAALLLADGDAAGAADVARTAQLLIEQSPDRGGSALDHALAATIIGRARQISA